MDLVTVLSVVAIAVIVFAVTIVAVLFVRLLRVVERKYSSRRSSPSTDNIQTFPAQIPSETGKSKEGKSQKLGLGGFLFIFSIIGTIVLVISTIISTRNFNIRRDAANEFLALALNWPIVLEETFDQNEIGWIVGEFSNELLVGDQTITDGKYIWNLEAKESPIIWSIPDVEPVSAFLLSVDAHLVSSKGSWESYFGLVFNLKNNGNFDSLLHSERVTTHSGGDETYYRSKYFQLIRLENRTPVVLIGESYARNSTYPGLVEIRHQPEGVAQLMVVSEGSTFHFFMDGEYLDSYENEQAPTGNVGLAVSLPAAGEEATIEFDNFVLRTP